MKLDEMDIKILRRLQSDCTEPLAEMAREVGLSTTPLWRRIQRLEAAGIVSRRVALIDRRAVRTPVTVFVSIVAREHSAEWLEKFNSAVQGFPEVTEFFRMSGDVDYLLKVVVPDIAAYDAFYKRLIGKIEIHSVSSAFAMEDIKYTTELPLDYALGGDGEGKPEAKEGKKRS